MRGLLMIEPLYHQTIAGNKTQTRRSGGLELVNGAKATKTKPAIIANPDDWDILGIGYGLVSPNEAYNNLLDMFEQREPKIQSPLVEVNFINNKTGKQVYCKPRYKVGEVGFIKEPWVKVVTKISANNHPIKGIIDIQHEKEYAYYYGCQEHHAITESNKIIPRNTIHRWGNKMFMPKDCPKRVFVRITGIKCERLMDISNEDCIAEGIETEPNLSVLAYKVYGKVLTVSNSYTAKPKDSFLSLYKFANKVKEVPNLWVWVYEFEYLPGYKHEVV